VTLQHTAIEAHPRDADALVAFFALLGFAEVQPPESLLGRTRWVQRDGTQIHLLLTDDPVVPPAAHVAVVAPDYDATLEALRAAGHEVADRAEHWGAPRAFATAPGGHRVEVMSRAPGCRSGHLGQDIGV
jgi:catechol 2,3-dioxygenase-like lactoylglutathione lyase family enzyme